MKFRHILLSTLALFAAVALAGCSTIQKAESGVATWFAAPSTQAAVATVKAETETLLQKFVFTAGAKKLTGASWADSGAAAIYAAENELADNPLLLNTLLGTFLPPDSRWTPVIEQLATKLISGQLATKAQRIAALEAIAATLNAQAATARTP